MGIQLHKKVKKYGSRVFLNSLSDESHPKLKALNHHLQRVEYIYNKHLTRVTQLQELICQEESRLLACLQTMNRLKIKIQS